MRSVTPTTGPVHPAALGALQSWLWDNHYSVHAIDAIVAHAAEEGTPTGSPYLDREDEEAATEAFIAAMPAVSSCSPEWGNATGDESMFRLLDDAWTPVETLRALPPELDDDETALLDAWDRLAELEMARLEAGRPADGPAPYEPTEEDLAAYGAWLEQLEREQLGAMLAPISGGAPDGPTAEDRAGRMRELLDDPSYGAL
jgi:hypothetical protein